MGYLSNHDFEICASMIGQNTSTGVLWAKKLNPDTRSLIFIIFYCILWATTVSDVVELTTAATCSPDSVHFLTF